MSVAPYAKESRNRAGRWRAALCAFVLAPAIFSTGCAGPSGLFAVPPVSAEPGHRVSVVHHGYHTGIVVPTSEAATSGWGPVRDFPKAEYLEIGWGDRDFYMTPSPGLWLGVRALFWPTPSVLHAVAFVGPVDRRFPEAGVVELTLAPPGFSALLGAVQDSGGTAGGPDERAYWPPALAPGLYASSLFYAAWERFHLFRNCNVWVARVLAAADVPLRPGFALTADSLFAQLRPHGIVLREPR